LLRQAPPPQGSDLLLEHLRAQVLRPGHLRPEVLRSGPLLRPGHLLDLRAEDLLPEALQTRSDLPSEHLCTEVLRPGLLCSGVCSGVCSGHLCAGVLRAVLQAALPPRTALPPQSQVLLRKHLWSELLWSSRPLLWPDHGSTGADSDDRAAGPDPREEDLSISVSTDWPQEPIRF
jgi:hypothetical protein